MSAILQPDYNLIGPRRTASILKADLLITIAIDASPSAALHWQDIEKLIRRFINIYAYDNCIFLRLIQFADTVTEIHSFKPIGNYNIKDYVDCLRLGKLTALKDAVLEAVYESFIETASLDNKTDCLIFIFTDGLDNCSQSDAQDVYQAISMMRHFSHCKSIGAYLIGIGIDAPFASVSLNDLQEDAGLNDYLEFGGDFEDFKDCLFSCIRNFINKSRLGEPVAVTWDV